MSYAGPMSSASLWKSVSSVALTAGLATAPVDFTNGATGGVARTVQDKGLDIRSFADFGVVGDDSTDDTVNLQKAWTWVTATPGRLLFAGKLSGKTIKLTASLTVGSLSGTSYYTIDLQGATLKQYTANTPIISFTQETNFEWEICNGTLTYAVQPANTDTSANCMWFTTTTNVNNGHFNFRVRNVTFLQAYGGMVSDRLNAFTCPVWGARIIDCRWTSLLIGPCIDWRQTASGQPNNQIRGGYLKRDPLAATIAFLFAGCYNLTIANLEFNKLYFGLEIQLESCFATLLQNVRFESGTIGTAGRGLITLSGGSCKIISRHVNNVTAGGSGASYVIRAIAGAVLTEEAPNVSSPMPTSGGGSWFEHEADSTSRIRISNDRINASVISRFNSSGVVAQRLTQRCGEYSDAITIADDNAKAFSHDPNRTGGKIIVSADNNSAFSGEFIWNSATTAWTLPGTVGANFNTSTTTLAGTTGTDTKVTAWANSSGWGVENRSGGSLTFRLVYI